MAVLEAPVAPAPRKLVVCAACGLDDPFLDSYPAADGHRRVLCPPCIQAVERDVVEALKFFEVGRVDRLTRIVLSRLPR